MTTKTFLRFGFAAFVVVSLVVLWLVNPEQAIWTPKCMVHLLTGLQCPGCGISRATHALLHGRFYEALAYNWFFIISIPYFLTVCAAVYVPALRRREKFRLYITGRVPALTYVVLFSLWFVIRNIYGI